MVLWLSMTHVPYEAEVLELESQTVMFVSGPEEKGPDVCGLSRTKDNLGFVFVWSHTQQCSSVNPIFALRNYSQQCVGDHQEFLDAVLFLQLQENLD